MAESAPIMNFSKKALKAYFKSIRNLELIPLLSIISFCLSILCFSSVFGFLLLNLAYVVNISFFAFLISESFALRKTSIYPLVFSSLSILLSVTTLWWVVSGLTRLSGLADVFLN